MAEIELSDGEALQALACGDLGALDLVYDRYAGIALALALRILNDRQAAEDIVQESFLAIWRTAGRYSAELGGLRTWLLRTVHRRCIDQQRARMRRVTTVSTPEWLDVPSSSDTWREVSEHLTGEVVREALLRLPSEQRESIELAYFGGLTHQEIAERTNTPLGTVKGRLRLALQKLSQDLSTHETPGI